MNTFFICATPRSRTAWLANYLTFGDSFCFHELLAECKDTKDLKKKLEATGKNVVGNSDSGNIFFFNQLKWKFPDTKIVVIQREKEDFINALLKCKFNLETNERKLREWADMYDGLQDIADNHLSFRYEQLNDAECCKEIFEYCTGQKFDYERWKLLSSLNVQVDTKFELERIKNVKKEIFSLFEN